MALLGGAEHSEFLLIPARSVGGCSGAACSGGWHWPFTRDVLSLSLLPVRMAGAGTDCSAGLGSLPSSGTCGMSWARRSQPGAVPSAATSTLPAAGGYLAEDEEWQHTLSCHRFMKLFLPGQGHLFAENISCFLSKLLEATHTSLEHCVQRSCMF